MMPSEKLTRFYSASPLDEIRTQISATLERMVVQFKLYPSRVKYQFQTVDKRQCPMHGEVNLQVVGDASCLVVFSRHKVYTCGVLLIHRAIRSSLRAFIARLVRSAAILLNEILFASLYG
jgi:serine/threonine-protein kinase Chk1